MARNHHTDVIAILLTGQNTLPWSAVFEKRLSDIIDYIKNSNVLGTVSDGVLKREYQTATGLPHAHVLFCSSLGVVFKNDLQKILDYFTCRRSGNPKVAEQQCLHMTHSHSSRCGPKEKDHRGRLVQSKRIKGTNDNCHYKYPWAPQKFNTWDLFGRVDYARLKGDKFSLPTSLDLLIKWQGHVYTSVAEADDTLMSRNPYTIWPAVITLPYHEPLRSWRRSGCQGSRNGYNQVRGLSQLERYFARPGGDPKATDDKYQEVNALFSNLRYQDYRTVYVISDPDRIKASPGETRGDKLQTDRDLSAARLLPLSDHTDSKDHQLLDEPYRIRPDLDLTHVPAYSYDDLKTFKGKVYDSFCEATVAGGIIAEDNEYVKTLNDLIAEQNSPACLRHFLLTISEVSDGQSNSNSLIELFSYKLSCDWVQDFLAKMLPKEQLSGYKSDADRPALENLPQFQTACKLADIKLRQWLNRNQADIPDHKRYTDEYMNSVWEPAKPPHFSEMKLNTPHSHQRSTNHKGKHWIKLGWTCEFLSTPTHPANAT
eukprot:g78278.t1